VATAKAAAREFSVDISYTTFFEKLITRIPGLQSVVVSDRDGVSLVKVVHPSINDQSTENSLAAAFAVATDQASKLRMGKNKTLLSFFKDRLIVHISNLPIVISLIADQDANAGMLVALAPELTQSLSGLSTSILNLEDEEDN